MNNKNYYEILEVDKYSTQENIKKSYKKLALKYHPDKNNDNEECKKKFQDITEAYSTLSDDEKRKRYDMFGIEENDMDFSEDPFKMFNNIFKEHLNQFQNMHYENNIDLGGVIKELSGLNFNNLFDIPKVHVEVHSMNNRSNIKDIINDFKNEKNKMVDKVLDEIIIHENITMREIYNKDKKEISYVKDKFRKGKIVKRKVKLDIDLFDKEIILNGNGNETENKKGNVLIYLHNNDENFIRINEYDIFHNINVDFKQYYSNELLSIKLPNDEILYINNCEGNKIIKIKNKGIPYKKEDEYLYGDLYCCFSIKMPNLDSVYDIVNDLISDDLDEKKENINFTEFKYVNYNDMFQD